ncbi:MAG: hypothetical protein QOH58_764 [Thermoleophilaceae bacterium]|jgi:hypothetical protein|nr:hypothetical protein [Thermoleophilaceae bacterium]
MTWEFHVLVVANMTATSDELLAALRERADRGACRFTLLMPREGPGADSRLDEALGAMREAGLEQVTGHTGNPDPIVAAMEIWDPMRFDEIVVSTFPTGSSRWLGLDLPRRLEKLTAAPVRHVVSQPPSEVHHWERPPEHETYGLLSPLAAALQRRNP